MSDTEKGNGALDYPVGLITADEIVAAGSGKYNTKNTNYYLSKSRNYFQWSLSPRDYSGSYAGMFCVPTSGNPDFVDDGPGGAFAPVINLSPEYASTLIGTGTITDPYRT